MYQAPYTSFFTPAPGPLTVALPGDAPVAEPGARAAHAQALAYAGRRRRAALEARERENGVDNAYWKAGVPAAIARAAALRAAPNFARLP
jgi:hypothetical protein